MVINAKLTQELFDELDSDHSGAISMQELSDGLRAQVSVNK